MRRARSVTSFYARTGLVTFNGPAVMTDLGEFPAPLAYTVAYMEKALCSPEPVGAIRPSVAWTEDVPSPSWVDAA